MSFFNKMKSLFIVEDDELDSPQSSVEHINTPKTKVNNNKSISKKDSDKFVDILFKAIEKSNLEGFDYLEYIQSINNLKKQEFTKDERELFITAFSFAKTMNVNKNALVDSANHYLNVLGKEKTNFNESLNNNAKVKLQGKKADLLSVQKILDVDKNNFEKLKKKITQNESKVKELNEELINAGQKVEGLKAGFNDDLLNITSKITKDKEKIEKYLK